MFENEIKFIADFNLNKIKSYGAFITFEKLVKSEIHPAVIQYISAELDFLVAEDRKKLLQQSVFDYSGAEVSKYFNLIAQEVKKNKKIAYEDLKKLVIQAVSFNLNYIIRPNWSLTKLVYNEADHKSIEEIQLSFNYVYYNDFLKNIFLSYLSKRKLTSLSLTEFELILNKIDKELFSSQSQKFVDNTLFTLAEFINIGGVNKTKIPPFGVEVYLKEKNLMDYLFRLRKAFPNGVKQRYDTEDIRRIIYSTTPIEIKTEEPEEENLIQKKNPFVAEEEAIESDTEEDQLIPDEAELESPAQKETTIQDDIKISAKDKVENGGERKNKSEEEKKFLEEDINLDALIDDDLFSLNILNDETKSDDNKTAEMETGIGENKFEIEKKNELDSLYDFEEETNELLKEFNVEEEKEIDEMHDEIVSQDESDRQLGDFTPEIEEESKKKEDFKESISDFVESFPSKIDEDKKINNSKIIRDKDLFDFMDDKDVRKIVSNVFNDDKEDFAHTMERLSECNNYEEATDILKSVFITYRVNPYSKEAVTLTNSVAQFFTRT